MTLSFVVPAYNEERYLLDCLQSILNETASRNDVEIIVVNNASTDSTREAALRFPGVRVVDEPRKGLPHARQAGFLASSGRLIANVDADSRLPQGWVTQVLSAFAEDTTLVALSGPLVYYDLSPRESMLVRVFYTTAWITYVLNRYVLRVGSMVQGGNFVLRRDALAGIGGYSDRFTFYGEDTDIANRMSRIGDVRFTYALTAKSSGRRLRGDGLIMTGLRYGANYLWATYFGKPFTTAWNDYR